MDEVLCGDTSFRLMLTKLGEVDLRCLYYPPVSFAPSGSAARHRSFVICYAKSTG